MYLILFSFSKISLIGMLFHQDMPVAALIHKSEMTKLYRTECSFNSSLERFSPFLKQSVLTLRNYREHFDYLRSVSEG